MRPTFAYKILLMIAVTAVLSSCKAKEQQKSPLLILNNQAAPQATSLLGTSLQTPPLAPSVIAEREHDLQSAQYNYDRDPHNEQAIVWLGRRLAYLGRYNDAIDTFSNGLAIHPESHILLRHRGHRYITVRKFDLACADLQRAADLIEQLDLPDEVEPDGQPNALNIPTSTSHTNIYYHLGLVRYLLADYDKALHAYRSCMEYATNDDMRIATLYWQYLTLRRLDKHTEAATLLQPVARNTNIIENKSYHRLILMFKGDLSPDDVRKPGDDNQPSDIDAATTGYAIGMWYLFQSQSTQAIQHFHSVISETNWAAFGHIAAEAELARVRHGG